MATQQIALPTAILYIHGLDSNSHSVKGRLLAQYCQRHHPTIRVYQPDLNHPPSKVLVDLLTIIHHNPNSLLMGSSLGGYFASLLHQKTACPAVLLNPSIRPDISLQRFFIKITPSDQNPDPIGYTTQGGWSIRQSDLDWFAQNRLQNHSPNGKIFALIKQGDELLNAQQSATFFEQMGARVTVQQGGDHRMSDFDRQLPLIFDWIKSEFEKK